MSRLPRRSGFDESSIGRDFRQRLSAYCLGEAGVTLSDVEHIAVNSDPSASFRKKVAYALRRRPSMRLILDRVRNQAKRQSIGAELAAEFPGPHSKARCIASSITWRISPRRFSSLRSRRPPWCRSMASATSPARLGAIGRGTTIDIEGRVYFPHSLGVFYQALTQYLGFPHYGDEYKVMGLAPYGEPTYLRANASDRAASAKAAASNSTRVLPSSS